MSDLGGTGGMTLALHTELTLERRKASGLMAHHP